MTTNFDRYYAEQLKKPGNKERFEKASIAIDIALQITRLREDAGYSQAQLAKALNTSQQQISRLESINYEGHSVSMLRRIAEVLNSRVVVRFEKINETASVREAKGPYKVPPKVAKRAAKKAAKKIGKRVVKKKSAKAKY